MLTIDLKGPGRQAGPAVRFLNSQLDEPLRLDGSQVQLTSTRDKTAKLLLHKFLRQSRLENYIVIVHPGLVEVLGPESKKRHAQPENLNFFPANDTIPYYQAVAGIGIVSKPGRRKWRP
jgi:hypothetical protein